MRSLFKRLCRSAAVFLVLFAPMVSTLRAVVEFTQFEGAPVDRVFGSDCTVTADGRFLTLWAASHSTDPTKVELLLSELEPTGNIVTRSLGILGDASHGTFAFRVRIDTNGGKTWAVVRRESSATNELEIALAQLSPIVEQPVFKRFVGGVDIDAYGVDLAVGDDGLPRVLFRSSTVGWSVARLEGEDAVVSSAMVAPAGTFFASGASLAVAGGQIAVTATSLGEVSPGVFQSYLRVYQATEPATFADLAFATSQLVTTNASADGAVVANRQRSVFISGSISPAIIYRDDIDAAGKLAVRDTSLGWQAMTLPTVSGSPPGAFYVDIDADDSGVAHLIWWASSRPAYATFSSGGSILPQGDLTRGSSTLGVATGAGGNAFVASYLGGETDYKLYLYLPTDLTDLDTNGFNVLEEEAFGISPGNENLTRAPNPQIFEEGDGRRYRAVNFWRRPGGSGAQPYIVDDLAYRVESSIDLKTWYSTTFSALLAESFTIAGRGQFVVYRAPVDVDSINDSPTFFRVRVERLQ